MQANILKPKLKLAIWDARLMAIVAEGDRGRVYLRPDSGDGRNRSSGEAGLETGSSDARESTLVLATPLYGLKTYGDLFTPRQLVRPDDLLRFGAGGARTGEARRNRPVACPTDGKPLARGGTAAAAYADAVGVYLAFAIDRLADYNSVQLLRWKPSWRAS